MDEESTQNNRRETYKPLFVILFPPITSAIILIESLLTLHNETYEDKLGFHIAVLQAVFAVLITIISSLLAILSAIGLAIWWGMAIIAVPVIYLVLSVLRRGRSNQQTR